MRFSSWKSPRLFRRKTTILPILGLMLGLWIALWGILHPVQVLSFPALAQASGSLEELQQQQKQIDQERSTIDQEQDHLQNMEQSAQKQLGGLRNTIKATSAQITQNEKQLKAATQKLTGLQKQLAIAEKSYQGKQFATVARLRFLQRQQGSRGWALLLQSKNLNEFLDRRYQLRRVYQADQQILAQLQAASKAIEKQRRGVENQKNEIALLTQQLQAQKAEYQAQEQSQQELIKRLRQDQAALEAAEDQLARDSTNLSILIQQRVAASSRDKIVIRGTGALSFPSDGEITSVFGYRMHPILGYSKFHDGLDFGADYGAPIRAANAGVVIFAGWYGGYGQAVIIDHGNNTTTLYGHTSEIYVSEGESVQRGQLVAAVGSTGFSTGPHLHFEVRVSGEPVDPLNYL